MNDILDKLDEALFEIKSVNKSLKEIDEMKLEENFNLKVESYFEDDKVENMIGKYDEYVSNANERFINFSNFLDECVKKTKSGEFTDGDKLYVTPRHAKNLKDEAIKMFKFDEEIMLKTPGADCNRADMQAYLNERSIGARGENRESTMQGIKTKIQKINLFENIATGSKNNYSSNIRTQGEIADFKALKGSKSKKESNNKNKGMSEEDYNKVYNPLFEKLTKDPASVTEAEAGFLLAGEFGLRPSTILKIDINQVNVRDCGIEVEIEDNKSKQMFMSRTSAVEPVNPLSQQLLAGLYKRALLKYKTDEDGNMKLVNCCEQNLHQGFEDIANKYNINMSKYEGKYKTLRHMYGQRVYTEHRQAYIDADETDIHKKAAALKEVNYLLGHEYKKISTTMGYIKNIW